MKKVLVMSLSLIMAAGLLTGCGHEHEWSAANCQTPSTCAVCGKTQGELGEHDYAEATCEAPKTCKICGVTEGEALGHDYAEATCAAPKTCKNCGKTEGEALEHDWMPMSLEAPKTCKNCGLTEGGILKAEEVIYDLSFLDNYYWHSYMTPEKIMAVTNSYKFMLLDINGNKIKDLSVDDADFAWGTKKLGGKKYLYIACLTNSELDFHVYDENGDELYNVPISYDDITKNCGPEAANYWWSSYAYANAVDDRYFAIYPSELGKEKTVCYIDSTNGAVIWPKDIKLNDTVTETKYDESKYSYVEPMDNGMIFVATLDESQWGFIDNEGNELTWYTDVSAFNPEGFAFASNDRKTYFIIDEDFNVVADNFVAGKSSSYSSTLDKLVVTDENDVEHYYNVYVAE